jgi:formiminotetrahydrofolate cyclodeaminase
MINNNHNYSKDNTVNKQTAISSNNFFEEIEDSEFNLDDKTISDFDNKQNLFQSKINDQTYSNKLNLTYKKDEQLNSDRYENINNYNNEGAEN